jgi:hypothetical protein
MANPPKFLSFNWLRAVAEDTRISIVHRLTLIRLCLHRFNDGRCNPGYDIVASEIGVHRATVFRAIDVGVRFGWLTKPIRHGQGRADFVFNFPSNVAGVRRQKGANVAGVRPQENPNVAPVQSQSRTRAHAKSQRQRASSAKSTASTRNGGSNGKENGGKKESQTPDQVAKKKEASGGTKTSANPAQRAKSSSHDEKTAQRAADDGGEAFDRFWAAYPKRVAKEAARKAFAKAAENGTDVEALIAGAQRYAAERQGQDQKFTKHPATWLNAGCWEDEAPGAPVIDEHGNVVAFEREQEARPSSNKSPLEIYEEWLEENPSLRW